MSWDGIVGPMLRFQSTSRMAGVRTVEPWARRILVAVIVMTPTFSRVQRWF